MCTSTCYVDSEHVLTDIAYEQHQFSLGNAAFVSGKYQLSMDHYNTCLQSLGNSDDEFADTVCLHRGRTYMKMGDYASAIEDFNSLDSLRVDMWQLELWKAEAMFLKGDYFEAANIMVDIVPNNPRASEKLASLASLCNTQLTAKKARPIEKLYVDESEDDNRSSNSLQGYLMDIYERSDEDSKRAMNKSFQTSGGTLLSTDWSDVKTKDYESLDRPETQGIWKKFS